MLRICGGEDACARIWAGFGGDCTFPDDGDGGGVKDNLPSPSDIRLTVNAFSNASSLKYLKASWVSLDIFLPCHEQGARENEEEGTIHVTCGKTDGVYYDDSLLKRHTLGRCVF